MDKLNNEELQSVSAGGDSSDIPSLEKVFVYMCDVAGQCKYCGTPTYGMHFLGGPDVSGNVCTYHFQCKCPSPNNAVDLRYYMDTKSWNISENVVYTG